MAKKIPPFPWKKLIVDKDEDDDSSLYDVRDANGNEIADSVFGGYVDLLVAAPEILAMLKEFATMSLPITGQKMSSTRAGEIQLFREAAYKVIAKAEGRAP